MMSSGSDSILRSSELCCLPPLKNSSLTLKFDLTEIPLQYSWTYLAHHALQLCNDDLLAALLTAYTLLLPPSLLLKVPLTIVPRRLMPQVKPPVDAEGSCGSGATLLVPMLSHPLLLKVPVAMEPPRYCHT